MSAWSPTRTRVASAAVTIAAITGFTGALLGATVGFAVGGTAFVTLTVLALSYPIAIAGQVTTGSLIAGSLILSESAPASLVLAIVAGIVATAELLALAARLKTPQARIHGDDLSRVGVAIIIGGGVFGAVQVLGGLPGPTGLLAVALASTACVAVSLVLVGRTH